MKIELQVSGSSTTLADDANGRTASTSSPLWGGAEVDDAAVEFAVQTVQPIGAAHARHYPRRNASGLLRFSTTCLAAAWTDTSASPAKSYTALENASRIFLAWQKDCPASGTLLVDGVSWGAAGIKTLRMKRTGATVRAEYEIAYETNRSS